MRHKINLVFEELSFRRFTIGSIIRKCISETLAAERISVPCEINVLVTNDEGIHVINKTSRDIDRPTDVLSSPCLNWSRAILPRTG